MTSNVEIYNLLNKVKIDDATITQLNTMTGRTAIDKDTVEFWSGVITVARAMKESRTYTAGLPIPELGEMKTVAVDDGASGVIQPSGTEVWVLQALNTDNCTAFLTDGSGIFPIILGGDGATTCGPLYITNKLYIGFVNSSGSAQTPGFAFQKVSL